MSLNLYIPPKERFGFMILILLIILGHTFNNLYDHIFGYSETEKLQLVAQIIEDQKNEVASIMTGNSKKEASLNDLSKFNPDTATYKTFMAYGLSEYAVKNIIKYRNAGGQFKSIKDLQKIYGIDSVHLQSISYLITFNKRDSASPSESHQHRNSNGATQIAKEKEINKLNDFDPNKASFESLVEQGISTYAARNLIKYRKKGGVIQRDSDLFKIYGLDQRTYEKIVSRISIDLKNPLVDTTKKALGSVKPAVDVSSQKPIVHSDTYKINLNATTPEELISIKGIGPYLSKAIIDYKEALGGYYDIIQLNEVYGLRPESFTLIKDHLEVKGPVEMIYIPNLTFKEVLKHPYIDYETTKKLKNISIMDFEKSLNEYVDQGIVKKELIPYLHFQDPNL